MVNLSLQIRFAGELEAAEIKSIKNNFRVLGLSNCKKGENLIRQKYKILEGEDLEEEFNSSFLSY